MGYDIPSFSFAASDIVLPASGHHSVGRCPSGTAGFRSDML